MIRIRAARAVKAVEPIVGPSKSPKGQLKGKKQAAKGKSREVWVVDNIRTLDEGAMHRRHIATWIVEKKVEIEMLWKEIEGLEEMLEE